MNNLTGIDVSHWQGTINWSTAAAAGCQFAIIKSTQGKTIFDSQFNANWAGAKANGIPRGAYHWFEPELDPLDQANWFWSHVGQMGELPLVLDVEDGYNIPADYAARLKQCIDRLVDLSGYKPMIYTRASYWKLYLGKAMVWADQYPLWVAHYKEYAGPLVCLPWTPESWSVWQFTSHGTGPKYGTVSLNVDMNVAQDGLPQLVPALHVEISPYLARVQMRAEADQIKAERATWQDRLAEWKIQRSWNPRKD